MRNNYQGKAAALSHLFLMYMFFMLVQVQLLLTFFLFINCLRILKSKAYHNHNSNFSKISKLPLLYFLCTFQKKSIAKKIQHKNQGVYMIVIVFVVPSQLTCAPKVSEINLNGTKVRFEKILGATSILEIELSNIAIVEPI